MAERPDLEYQVPILARELEGLDIVSVRVRDPIVLRLAIAGNAESLLEGRRIIKVTRRVQFVMFDLGEREIAVSPMLAGRFSIDDAGRRDRGDTTVALRLSDGRELRYRDRVRMGKFYIIPKNAYAKVPGLDKIGVDVLNPKVFTKALFRKLCKKRRDQLKLFLKDKSVLDSMGNAYADEVLFAAGLHPKTRGNKLTPEECDRLHDAVVNVLTDAISRIHKAAPALDVKLRDFVRVRNRKGEPCVVCKTTIRAVGVRGHDAFYCPECQPSAVGGFVNWRAR